MIADRDNQRSPTKIAAFGMKWANKAELEALEDLLT